MTDDRARLFLALWPGAAFRRALRTWSLPSLGAAAAKPVAPERLHLTLHFLGDVPRERVPALGHALRVPFGGFGLAFSHCQHWPHGLLVAVPDNVPQALTDLHLDLHAAIGRCGLPADARPWRPHVTLARRHAGALPPPARVPPGWQIRTYALVESRARTGGGYAVRHVFRASRPVPPTDAACRPA